MEPNQIEAILLIGMVTCAAAYWTTIITLVACNPKSIVVWSVAIIAVVIWPGLAFMSFMQLIVVIPIVTIFATHGFDMSKPMGKNAIWKSVSATLAFLACVWTIVQISGM